MKVTEEGMTKEPVKPEQKANALLPMEVTEAGMVSEPVMLEHPSNAFS